jgi:hypothetical protein
LWLPFFFFFFFFLLLSSDNAKASLRLLWGCFRLGRWWWWCSGLRWRRDIWDAFSARCRGRLGVKI